MKVRSWTAAVAALTLFPSVARAQEWRAMGPPGGDARVLASDPANARRLFLGTTDGHIFLSDDAGEHWVLAGRAGNRRDSVVTAIVVDAHNSNHVLVSTWTRDGEQGGGVFQSEDG